MPVYGLGTWEIGGTKEHNPQNNDNEDMQAIKNAIEEGITHIDTAEVYADGYCEILVGKAIKDYERKKLFLASKVYSNHLSYDDVITSARQSLRRLQTTYLDLYLTHRFNQPNVPIKDTMRALDTLVSEGLVKHIGVSNYTVEEIQEAQSFAKNKIVTAQQHFNLKYRESERKGILQYCQENDMLFTAYRPLQKGMILSAPIIKEMAKKYHKTSAQIAINWLIAQNNIVTISKTKSLDHLRENLGALGWQMEKADGERLRNEFPDQEAISDTVPLQ